MPCFSFQVHQASNGRHGERHRGCYASGPLPSWKETSGVRMKCPPLRCNEPQAGKSLLESLTHCLGESRPDSSPVCSRLSVSHRQTSKCLATEILQFVCCCVIAETTGEVVFSPTSHSLAHLQLPQPQPVANAIFQPPPLKQI